jgi:uncharacterized membrane protein YfcA
VIATIESLAAELVGLALVTLLAGLVRGFTGFGAGLLMAPWFLMLLGPSRAVPVLVALELVASARLVPSALREIDPRPTLSLGIPACLAVPLGSLLLVGLDPVVVRRAISLIILVFVVALVAGWRYRRRPSRVALAAAGTTSGLLSGFGGIGGPPVVLLLISGPDTTARNRATLIVFFALTQTAATIAFAFHGLMIGEVLWRTVSGHRSVAAGLFRHRRDDLSRPVSATRTRRSPVGDRWPLSPPSGGTCGLSANARDRGSTPGPAHRLGRSPGRCASVHWCVSVAGSHT